MMKVVSIEPSISEVIEMSEGFYSTYRRFSPEVWENLMGDG